MNYWWVNHSQTFDEEFAGGYIWSPRETRDGHYNQAYVNMTLVQAGDTVFSYADKMIRAIGVAKQSFIEEKRPLEFGEVGKAWGEDGYLVKIAWTGLRVPFSPSSSIEFIRDLLPKKYSPIQHKSGTGNQGQYLSQISQELNECLIALINALNNESTIDDLDLLREQVIADRQEAEITHATIHDTEREQIIKSRRGQGIFRENVVKVERSCRITGVTDHRFLIASHIKPWKDSNNSERLDGNNGLLLSPHVDALFDKGWISFGPSGNVLVHQYVSGILSKWHISTPNVGSFNKEQSFFLEYHRDNVFAKNTITPVAAGILEHNAKVLIARRKKDRDFAGLWEFPGGKIEDGETPEECLIREFLEEFSVKIAVGEYVGQSLVKTKHGKKIHLMAFRARLIAGTPALLDHEKFEWVSIDDLPKIQMAPADVPIAQSLKAKI